MLELSYITTKEFSNINQTVHCTNCDCKFYVNIISIENIYYCPFCGIGNQMTIEDCIKEMDRRPTDY